MASKNHGVIFTSSERSINYSSCFHSNTLCGDCGQCEDHCSGPFGGCGMRYETALEEIFIHIEDAYSISEYEDE